MRILIAGVSGMLGFSLYRYLGDDPSLQIMGTMRGDPAASVLGKLPSARNRSLVGNILRPDDERLQCALAQFKPNAIINCIGWRRQPQCEFDNVKMIEANSLWPHQLALLAGNLKARLIHFSSDAVFSGRRGHYREEETPDPADSYGLSKLLGEPDYRQCITLRTSLIGHSPDKNDQLIDWFVRQKGKVNGYQRAIFSGLPTIEIASIVRNILLKRIDLFGVWHLASSPISKFELLSLVTARYGLDVKLKPTSNPVIDRSLDGARFAAETGYVAPSWPELIDQMCIDQENYLKTTRQE